METNSKPSIALHQRGAYVELRKDSIFMKKEQYEEARLRALEFYRRAAIVLTEEESRNLEVADFGLGDLWNTGLEIVTYINTEKCCGKEMVLFPGQTCPEHRHAPFEGNEGKEETFRCRWGEVYLYVEGEAKGDTKGRPPKGSEAHYTVWHEVVLRPGEQYTIYPNTRHWFQGGPQGAVVSEFSTKSYDEYDIFTDPNIRRMPEIEG